MPITLSTLREHEQDLHGLLLLAPGSRLSITPVKPAHWKSILKLEGRGP
ncbi:MAG TPA: EVE domain-containing protein [Solimonas sp.]